MAHSTLRKMTATHPRPHEMATPSISRGKHSLILVVLSALGFLDALFLSYEHFMGLIPPCIIQFKCDLVTTSSYSVIFSIPVPYLGLAYYLTLFIGSLVFLENKNSVQVLKFLTIVSGIGFFGSLYFTYIQGFVLNAWCLYCIFSAIISTLFFVTTVFIKKKISKASY